MEESLQSAIRDSFLAALPPEAVASLADGAVRVEVPAGARTCGPDGEPSVRLVSLGLLRIVRVVPDGRTIAQRYLRRGDVAGIGTPFHNFAGRPTGRCDVLMHSVFYEFPKQAWRRAAERDARVAVAFLEELSRIAEISIEQMANRALASMRQRVVRQLLDAADGDGGTELVAAVTQQQLAEGVGSAREVVARVLQTLRADRLIETRLGRVVLLDPETLYRELSAP